MSLLKKEKKFYYQIGFMNKRQKKINVIVYQQPKIARKNKKSEDFRTIVNIKEKLLNNCVVTIIDSDPSIEWLKNGEEYLVAYDALKKIKVS